MDNIMNEQPLLFPDWPDVTIDSMVLHTTYCETLIGNPVRGPEETWHATGLAYLKRRTKDLWGTGRKWVHMPNFRAADPARGLDAGRYLQPQVLCLWLHSDTLLPGGKEAHDDGSHAMIAVACTIDWSQPLVAQLAPYFADYQWTDVAEGFGW